METVKNADNVDPTLNENREKLISNTIKKIYELFEQLHHKLVNPHETVQTKTIFDDLNQVFCQFTNRRSYNPIDAVNLFEFILSIYLNLIDDNRLIECIARRFTWEYNIVFSSLFDSITQEDTLNSMKQWPLKARQQKYFRILDQISSSKQVKSFLRNELSTTVENSDDNLQQAVGKFCALILLMALEMLNNLNIKFLDIELNKYQQSIFIPFIAFIDEHFVENRYTQNDILIQKMLEFLHATSKHVLTIPIFIHANCAQACLRWLALPSLKAHEYAIILRMTYNIARHDDGAIVLDQNHSSGTLNEFYQDTLSTLFEFIINKPMCAELQLIYFMINVLTSPDLSMPEMDNKNWFIRFRLLTAINDGMQSRTYRDRTTHMSELMIVLMILCTNDDAIHRIFGENGFLSITYIFEILDIFLFVVEVERSDYHYLSSDVLTLLAIANILWSFSFHSQYRTKLIENKDSLEKLEKFSSSDVIQNALSYIYLPRHMSSLRRTIDGIMENFKFSSDTISGMNCSNLINESIGSIMLSYSHFDIDFCRQLYDGLSKYPDFSIDVDFNNAKYAWKDLAKMIEQADLIIFLISANFFHSKSCRQQFIYVTQILKKRFIAVLKNADYHVKGWLASEINQSNKIHFDNNDMLAVCNEIRSFIKPNSCEEITSNERELDIEQWTKEDLKRWFENNHLMSELHDFYQFQNGNELLLYADAMLASSWTKEYDRIKTRFEEKSQQQYLSPHEFFKFVNALKHLIIKNLNSI